MPIVNIPISDTLETIERPIIYDIINRLCVLTGINTNTQIRFYGAGTETAQQWNSSLNKNKELNNLYPLIDNLTIEVEENYDPNRMISIAVENPENPLIFLDEALGIYIKPVRSPTDVIVTFKYKARDRNVAMRWRNEIRTKTAKNREINMHDINYSWHLPETYIDALYTIWKLRNSIGSYNDTFETWFYKCASDQITIVSNLAGKGEILAIAEKQVGIQGLYDFEGVPDRPEKEGDVGMWVVSFTYKFKYDKPINTVFNYPLVVHQQLLPEPYRLQTPPYSLQAQWLRYSASGLDFSYFQADNQTIKAIANRGLDIPAFDTFYPGSILSYSLRIFSVLTNITPDNQTSLFNLSDLGDFNLDQDILDFIRLSEFSYITQTYQSILQLNLYEGTYIKDPSLITVDSTLNVSATTALDLRKVYHVRLSMVCNLSLLTSAAIARLKAYPIALAKIVSAINQSLPSIGNVSNLNSLSKADLGLLGLPGGINPNTFGATTVQTLFVATKPNLTNNNTSI